MPTNPISGGIPANDKITNTVDIQTKLYLLKIFKSLSVFIFFISYKNNKQKKRYKINIYIYMFKYIIATPLETLLFNTHKLFWENK